MLMHKSGLVRQLKVLKETEKGDNLQWVIQQVRC